MNATNNTVFAGLGNDFISSRTVYTAGTVNTNFGSIDISSTAVNTVHNSTFYGDAGTDTFLIYGSSNTLDGGTEDDTLVTYGNGNKLIGGTGADYLLSDGSNNAILGGIGDDYLSIDGFDLYANANSLIAAEGNDTLVSYKTSSTTLDGGIGDDAIYLAGYDVDKTNSFSSAYGGIGNDYFYLGYAEDFTLNGNDGYDTFDFQHYSMGVAIGGAGADIFNINDLMVSLSLIGGTEKDTYNFNAPYIDTMAGSDLPFVDVFIGDFKHGEDKVNLSSWKTAVYQPILTVSDDSLGDILRITSESQVFVEIQFYGVNDITAADYTF